MQQVVADTCSWLAPWMPVIGFGLLATWVGVRALEDISVRGVGLALVVSYALSNVFQHAQHVGLIDFETRVMVFAILESAVAAAAFVSYMIGGSRWLIAVVALATLSTIADFGVLLIVEPLTKPQVHLWNFICNLCYAGECLFTIAIVSINRGRKKRRDFHPSNARLVSARDADLWLAGEDR